jgi:HK97 family phage portal protein
MNLRELWYGTAPEPAEDSAHFHDSTLEALRVATELQQSSYVAEWTQKVGAVYRSAQLLSDLSASLPWYAVAGGQNSGQRQQSGPAERLEIQPSVLVRPDPFHTRNDWIRQAVLSLYFRGNAYLLKSSMVDGMPTTVQVLDPDRMIVSWNELRTRRVYRYNVEEIPGSRIDHLALNRLPGELVGTGPIDAIADTIAGQIAADRFARDLFTDGGIPTGLLEYPGKLNETEAKELLKVWNAAQVEARKTAVLSGGTTYSAISLSPDQAQMLQSRAFGVAEVARASGIPAHLLNAATGVAGSSGASMTYTNVRDVWQELTRLTLFPVYLERIAEAASGWLPRGQSVVFDDRVLLKADTTARYQAYSTALAAKILTVDEVREAEGLGPNEELNREKEEGRKLAQQIASGGAAEDQEEETADAAAES